jgi:hypothetical protein
MDTTKRIYQRTEAGVHALRGSAFRLGQESRTILRFLEHPRHFAEIVEVHLRRCSSAQILSRLEELEGAGLIESVAVAWLEELYRLGLYEPQPCSAALGERARLR